MLIPEIFGRPGKVAELINFGTLGQKTMNKTHRVPIVMETA